MQKENQNFIEDNIIVLSKQTIDLFLKQENPGELIALYTFYYYTAKWQQTNQPKCSTKYVTKGLHWNKDKVIKHKKKLIDMGLISDIRQISNETGRVTGWYIKINYIWKRETLQAHSPQNPEGGNYHRVDSEDTNALSANSINALSANREIQKNGTVATPPYPSYRSSFSEGGEDEKQSKLTLIKGTSETPHRLDGLDVASACTSLFGQNTEKLAYFFANIKGLHSNQIIRFLRTIKKDYSEEAIYTVISKIEHQMEAGEIAYYSSKYVINALSIVTEHAEGDDMEYKYSKFKQFCLDYFNDATTATEVYNFYAKTLNTKATSKTKEFDLGEANITERRIKNVKALTAEYGKDRFLKTMREFESRHRLGTLKSRTMSYFTNYLKKVATSKPIQNALLKPPPAPVSGNVVIPIRLDRIGNEPVEWELYNWTYQCSCGEQIDPWNSNCPKCKVSLDWEEAKKDLSQAIKDFKYVAEGGS